MGKVKRLELWWQLYLYVTFGSGLRKKTSDHFMCVWVYNDCRSQCKPWQRLFGHPCSLYLQAQSHSHCTGWTLFNKSHLTWVAGSIFRTTLLACFVSRTFDLPHYRYQYIMYVIRLVKSVGANLGSSFRSNLCSTAQIALRADADKSITM
jgi:hypothetical protein